VILVQPVQTNALVLVSRRALRSESAYSLRAVASPGANLRSPITLFAAWIETTHFVSYPIKKHFVGPHDEHRTEY
jgi:hypothetical protein